MPQQDEEYQIGVLEDPQPDDPTFADKEAAIAEAKRREKSGDGPIQGVWEQPHAEIVAIIFWGIVFVPS